MPKIQLKLVALIAGLVCIVVATSGYFAERGLRERELARIKQSLDYQTELVMQLVDGIPFDTTKSAALSEIVRRAQEATNARVTLVNLSGEVVADSDIAVEELALLDNHSNRPEIRSAIAGGTGTSTRLSATVGRPLLYYAKLLPDPKIGIVRLSVDLSTVETLVSGLRRELIGGALVSFLAAAVLTVLLSGLMIRPLQEIRSTLRAMAGGQLSRRLEPTSEDELAEIAYSINNMAAELERRLSQLTHDKEQLRAVLQGMMEGVLVTDPAGRIVLANARFHELFSLHGNAEGQLLLEVLRLAEVDDVLCAAGKANAPVETEIEFGSSGRVIRVYAVRVHTEDSDPGIVTVFHDMTDIRRLEAVRRDFVANASHELKTPLTAILGFAETLLSSNISPQATRSQLEIIRNHSLRLGQLVEDLLELSRTESRNISLELTAVDVASVANTVLQGLAPKLTERSIDAKVTQKSEVLAHADISAVEHILTNLLDNAIKYTDPGGHVNVEVHAEGGSVVVEVTDTGIGIPESDRSRIFERFYRVDKARSRALGGTGLGLAIVKHLVQSMDGDIQVESQLGNGSKFVFTLPTHPHTL